MAGPAPAPRSPDFPADISCPIPRLLFPRQHSCSFMPLLLQPCFLPSLFLSHSLWFSYFQGKIWPFKKTTREFCPLLRAAQTDHRGRCNPWATRSLSRPHQSLLVGERFFFSTGKVHLPSLGFSLFWMLQGSEGRSHRNLDIEWKPSNSSQLKARSLISNQTCNFHPWPAGRRFPTMAYEWHIIVTADLMMNGNPAGLF